MLTSLEYYKQLLEKENNKHANDKDFDYIIMLERIIKTYY